MWDYNPKDPRTENLWKQLGTRKHDTEKEKFNKWLQIMRKRERNADSLVYKKWPKRPLLNASARKNIYEDNKENNDFYFERCKKKCSKNRKNKKMWRKNPEYWEEYCEYCKPEEKTRRNLFSKKPRSKYAPISNNPRLYTLPTPDEYSSDLTPHAFLSRKDNYWRRTSKRKEEDDKAYHVFPPEDTYEMDIPCQFSDKEKFELENTPYSKYSAEQKKASLNWLQELRGDLAENYCCLDQFKESEKCRGILNFVDKKIEALKLVEPQTKKIYCPICKKQFENEFSFRRHIKDKKNKKSHPPYLFHPRFPDTSRYDYPRPDYSELSEEINPIPRLLTLPRTVTLDADTASVVSSFVGSSKRKPFSEY